jgi:hypothetical protein
MSESKKASQPAKISWSTFTSLNPWSLLYSLYYYFACSLICLGNFAKKILEKKKRKRKSTFFFRLLS